MKTQHNPMIKACYVLLVIFMFVFFSLLVRQYANAETQSVNKTKLPQQTVPLIYQSEHVVVGRVFTITLDNQAEKQITRAWTQYFSAAMPRALKRYQDDDFIYVAYSEYSQRDNTIMMTIGIKTDEQPTVPKGFKRASLKAGSYYQADSVLNTWQQAETLPVTLAFTSDFEQYAFNENFEIVTQKSWSLVTDEVNHD